MSVTYEQAFADHSYLWNTYDAAHDMTGGYVDSEDLDRLLASPTKTTARQCLINQIAYWFQVGPMDQKYDLRGLDVQEIYDNDPKVQEIAERYACSP